MPKAKHAPRFEGLLSALREHSTAAEQVTGVKEQRAESREPPRAKRWRVHLEAKIPIGENPLVVEAENEAQAWQKFCEVKRISDSADKRTITEVAD